VNLSEIMRQRHSGPVVWAMGSRVLAGISFLLLNSYLARRLGPVEFGTVAVVTSVAMAGSSITAAGVSRVLLRSFAGGLATNQAEQMAADHAVAGRMLIASIPIGALFTFLMSAFFIRKADDVVAASIAGAGVAIGAGLMILLADLLRGLGEVPMANLGAGRNGGALATAFFALLLAVTGRGLLSTTSVLVLNVVALAAAVGISAFVYQRIRPAARVKFATVESATKRIFVVSSLIFLLTQMAGHLAGQVDLWIASGNLSEVETGIYAAALRLMGVVSMPLLAAQLVLSSRIAGLHAQGRMKELEAVVRRSATIITVPSALILLPCVLVPGELLTLFYGSRYRSGGFTLAVLGLSQLINVITGMCGITLAMCSKERVLLWASLVWAVVAVVADLVSARVFGINGLAVSSALTTAGQYVTLWVLARVVLGLWTQPGWARIST
jgi:O-antigen/teichoic acid export membrane protein